jgi:hypothetical protein
MLRGGGLTSGTCKLSGARSLSDKRRKGAIAVAKGEGTGSNVSLSRFSRDVTHKPLCGPSNSWCLNLHFVEI